MWSHSHVYVKHKHQLSHETIMKCAGVFDWGAVRGLMLLNCCMFCNEMYVVSNMLNDLFFLLITDVNPDSVLFSLGIAEHFTRHEKMVQFLMSGESEAERGGLDITLLYDLMGLNEMRQQPVIPSLIYPSSEFNTKPLVDFVGSLGCSSKIKVQPDGRVLFTGTRTEMKHLLSVLAEFYSLKNSVSWEKHSVLVPFFDRYAWIHIPDSNLDSLVLQNQIFLNAST